MFHMIDTQDLGSLISFTARVRLSNGVWLEKPGFEGDYSYMWREGFEVIPDKFKDSDSTTFILIPFTINRETPQAVIYFMPCDDEDEELMSKLLVTENWGWTVIPEPPGNLFVREEPFDADIP